jgi:hypothetical protein
LYNCLLRGRCLATVLHVTTVVVVAAAVVVGVVIVVMVVVVVVAFLLQQNYVSEFVRNISTEMKATHTVLGK